MGDRASVESVVTADRAFWRGQRVLLTGHTGFKGAWLSQWLEILGAEVTGLGLAPDQTPSLWAEIASRSSVRSIIGDLRDPETVALAVASRPTIVIHMAAQALVRRGYRDPVGTFATNVVGTAMLLDRLRTADELQCVLVVTSDKVYDGEPGPNGFREDDRLGGEDPYSASKANQENTTRAFAASYFLPRHIPVVTARAGNVVGGGDWSENRLVPDIWRAAQTRTPLQLRYPHATRPWQHVLDCLNGYLTYVMQTVRHAPPAGGESAWPASLNFGRSTGEPPTVADVVSAIAPALGLECGWVLAPEPHPPEKARLTLDARLAHERLGWSPVLDYEETMRWTADWYREFARGVPVRTVCESQIAAFMSRSAV